METTPHIWQALYKAIEEATRRAGELTKADHNGEQAETGEPAPVAKAGTLCVM